MERLFVSFRVIFGIQVLIGLVLYFLLSPITTYYLYKNLDQVAGRPQAFFTLIHPIGMLIAFICCKSGEKKATEKATDKEKYKCWLVYISISFAIVLLTVPWPFYHLGRQWVIL
ncbi:hypothetical protein LT679_01835 [Mucilaginibacter roseus]|uniref:DUF4149 domain-containing protein n=1 Tax=Mucilaginibacter roseus TaxID=1528868 RepID=A0ABS8U0Q0_9SPHI|nr:hypothetical protein [Mucilaginibacter roseus]MCD8739329.1 hypothetical protein [Mucilaginibacter roseus]